MIKKVINKRAESLREVFLEMKQNKVSKTIRFCIERVNDFPIVFKFLGVTQIELPLFFLYFISQNPTNQLLQFFPPE